jgi:hypothetical protein
MEVVNLIHWTYLYGIHQMGMKDVSLTDKINPTFIALAEMAMHHGLLARKTAEFSVPRECGTGVGAQHKCNTRIITHMVNNA